MGEMTVMRYSLKLADGTMGHAYVQGRDKTKVEQAALVDALMQSAAAGKFGRRFWMLVMEAEVQGKATRAAKAAATKVEFFTMARGEDDRP